MNALTATGLHKRYASHHALRGLDMEIPQGSLFGLLGPNGAGKTSLFRVPHTHGHTHTHTHPHTPIYMCFSL